MRHVEWSTTAVADIRALIEYIAAENPQAARKVTDAIAKTGSALGEFATGHPGRVAGTYEKSVRGLPYVIAYALSGNDTVVSILRVIHTSRNWRKGAWPTA